MALAYADIPSLFGRMSGDEKHEWAAASTLDVLWVLYDRVLSVSPDRVDDPDRDRFLLSKGHGPQAYYAVLAAKGFISPSTLDSWTSWDSPLGQHPDRVLVPGVEIGSGSLGHGLPIGVGVAYGLRLQGRSARVFVLVGDAELDEGSNHEAIALAGRLGLGNLTVVVVDNESGTHGWPGGVASRFAVEGWVSSTVDGRSHSDLYSALSARHSAPSVVVARIGRS
jgi:transketolase